MVEEVRRMHEPEPGKGHVRVVEPDEEEPAVEPEPEPVEEPAAEEPAVEEPAEEAPAEEAAPEESTDELSALFSALRGDEPEPEPDPEPDPEPEPEPEPVDEAEAAPEPVEVPDYEPLLIARTSALLSVVNGALRGVKRELADAQNRALEALRVEGEWSPSQSRLSEQFAERLDEVRTAAYAVGWSAGGGEGDPEGAPEDVSVFAGDLAGSLLRAIGKGADTAARSTELSRTIRTWRTDSAERHLRAEATRAHAEGVAAAIRSHGGTPHLVVAERGCSQCKAAAGPLDGGVPPLHAECSCVVA